MTAPDLNLLRTLDVLLAECSVARAAERLHLSPSAMSRALARLRETTGDPLLVRAGRGLVPTPRALALRERVSQLVHDSQVVLRPAEPLNLKHLACTFTLRANDGFAERFGPALMARTNAEAPRVVLRFLPKSNRDSALLRDGVVDIETGVVAANTSPELRAQTLFRDRFVGVVRNGHALSKRHVTCARYVGGRHVSASRTGTNGGPVHDALSAVRHERDIQCIVSGYAAALTLARGTDLIATVPEKHTSSLRSGMHTFPLPFAVPELTIAMLWHPRKDADPAQRWLRGIVRDVCRT